MLKALNTAASGMAAQQRKINVTSNNIANVNTTGYKSSRAEFEELLYQQKQAAGNTEEGGEPTGVEVGTGVKTGSTQKNFSQGSLEQTDNPLDMAIKGDGFFRVRKQDGQMAYTRDGSFKMNSQGRLVNGNGQELQPSVVIPREASGVEITADGRVKAQLPGEQSMVEVGQVEVTQFTNPAGLKADGGNLFLETDASGPPRNNIPGQNNAGTISQGYLESSNVKVTEEMIDMITSQRSYELNSKVIRTADRMLRSSTNLK
jgi:flagellar basal-body rod protein FlgG